MARKKKATVPTPGYCTVCNRIGSGTVHYCSTSDCEGIIHDKCCKYKRSKEPLCTYCERAKRTSKETKAGKERNTTAAAKSQAKTRTRSNSKGLIAANSSISTSIGPSTSGTLTGVSVQEHQEIMIGIMCSVCNKDATENYIGCSTEGCNRPTHAECLATIKVNPGNNPNKLCKFCRDKEQRPGTVSKGDGNLIPATPTIPETPDTPASPTIPETPATPTIPETPNIPATPAIPTTADEPNNDTDTFAETSDRTMEGSPAELGIPATPGKGIEPTSPLPEAPEASTNTSNTEVANPVGSLEPKSCKNKKCNKTITEKDIKCAKCKEYTHLECITPKIPSNQKFKTYYCKECETRLDLIEWVLKNVGPKTKDQEDVEKIIDHVVDKKDGIREFRVRWLGYEEDDDTWHQERYLSRCLGLLQFYCREKGIPYSTIRGLMGADTSAKLEYNEDCWVSADEIIMITKRFRNMKPYKCNLELSTLKLDGTEEESIQQPPSGDKIIIVEFKCHCFIILYIVKDNAGYIADGINMCTYVTEITEEIERKTNIKLTPVSYNQQTRIDHCGGSGACIILSFMHAFKTNNIPMELQIAPAIRKRIIESIHDSKTTSSIAIFNLYNISNHKPNRCTCGPRIFKNKGALARHKQISGCK